MTKDDLKNRIEDLEGGCALLRKQIGEAESAAAQLRLNLAMTTGALEECKAWLSKVNGSATSGG